MSLLPSMGDLALPAAAVERQPSRTFKIDLERKRIVSVIDGQDAARQAIWKRLMTECDAYEIYGDSGYGIVLDDLKGQDRLIVEAEIKRRIAESLLVDDRVTGVHSFAFRGGLDDLHVSFVAETIFGQLREEGSWNMA